MLYIYDMTCVIVCWQYGCKFFTWSYDKCLLVLSGKTLGWSWTVSPMGQLVLFIYGAGWSNVNSQRHGCELQSKARGSDILWNEWSCHAHSIREHGISGKQSWGVGYPQLSSSGGDMPALRTFVVEGDIPHASHSRVEGICLPHFGRWHASQVTTTALLGPVKLYKLRMVLSWELTN